VADVSRRIYAVVGPGRTGSLMLCEMISSSGSPDGSHGGLCDAVFTKDDPDSIAYLAQHTDHDIVIHSHDAFFDPRAYGLDPSMITLVVSRRRSLFHIIMSNIVARITGEYHDYTNKQPQPCQVDASEFVHIYEILALWYQDLDTSLAYHRVVNIYYEQLISSGPAWLCEQLGVTYHPDLQCQPCQRSPNDYRLWISNWQQLEWIYGHYEQWHLSAADTDDWLSLDHARASSILHHQGIMIDHQTIDILRDQHMLKQRLETRT